MSANSTARIQPICNIRLVSINDSKVSILFMHPVLFVVFCALNKTKTQLDLWVPTTMQLCQCWSPSARTPNVLFVIYVQLRFSPHHFAATLPLIYHLSIQSVCIIRAFQTGCKYNEDRALQSMIKGNVEPHCRISLVGTVLKLHSRKEICFLRWPHRRHL